MTFDESQRLAIECDTNVVVTAGAGSGKTTVLAERFVRLIREGKALIDQILTLTFTRKAASEMYDRIYRKLLEEEQTPTVQTALSHFETAQISTLDSFCSRIVRNDAGRFGITRDFTVSEEDTLRTVGEAALSFVLENQSSPGVRTLIAENGMQRTLDDCLVPLGMDVFTLADGIDLEAMRERQAQVLRTELERGAAEMSSLSAAILDLPGSTTTMSSAHAAARRTAELEDLLDAQDYQGIADAVTALAGVRKPGSNSKRAELLQLAEIIEELRPRAAATNELALSILAQEKTRDVFEALSAYREVIQRAKRSTGRLTFQDVVDMAVASLSRNAELRRHYKRRFRYIMIDEFQDNNQMQKQLLYLLAEHDDRADLGVPPVSALEPDKLYFVGDEKQSIYRFRGADVRVFKSLSSELAQVGGQSLQLLKNYRSHPRLVAFFNTLFDRLLGGPDAGKQEYEADFAELQAGREPADGPVHIDILYKPFSPEKRSDYLANDEAEAYAVAEYIRRAVASESLLVDDGTRPARYDDFAILLRSGTTQATFERMLRHFDVPYNAGTVRSLFLEAPVNDIYNLLQIVAYPTDRLAYASFLRSPLCGLSDEAIIDVLRAEEAPFSPEAHLILSGEDAEKLARGGAVYRDIRAMADLVPTARLVSRIWFDWGYRYVLLSDPRYHSYLEHYDYVHELALRYSGRPLVAFLDAIRPLLGKFERIPDLEVLGRDEAGVQILTIHKSKGLEFPVVIVANMGNVGRGDDGGSTPYYYSDEHGITLNLSPPGGRDRANYFYRLGKEANDAQELAEIKRILYVAATRAESHLVFSGYHHAGNRTRSGAMLNMLIESLGIDVDDIPDEGAGGEMSFGSATVSRIPDVPRTALRGDWSSRARRSADEAAEAYAAAATVSRPPRRFDFSVTEINAAGLPSGPTNGAPPVAGTTIGNLDDPDQAVPSDAVVEELGIQAFFGTLCHSIVESLLRAEDTVPRLDDVRWPSVVGQQDRRALLDDATVLAKRFLQTAWWQDLWETASHVESEVELILHCPVDDVSCFLRGVVDVLAVTEEEVVVVDFKTDRIVDTSSYALQMSLYAEAVAGLYAASSGGGKLDSGPEVRLFLVHLRSAEAVPVDSVDSPLERAGETIRSLWTRHVDSE